MECRIPRRPGPRPRRGGQGGQPAEVGVGRDRCAIEARRQARGGEQEQPGLAEAARLLDAFEVRRAEAARERQERARAEHVRLFAPALRKVIADLRARGDAAHLAWEVDYPSRRWPPHSWRLVCGGWSFLEAARGRVPVQRLARAALGGKLVRWSPRRAECLDLLAERMCETRRPSCAQVAAALWLQLQRLELTAERAADLLEAERLRRA